MLVVVRFDFTRILVIDQVPTTVSQTVRIVVTTVHASHVVRNCTKFEILVEIDRIIIQVDLVIDLDVLVVLNEASVHHLKPLQRYYEHSRSPHDLARFHTFNRLVTPVTNPLIFVFILAGVDILFLEIIF